MADFKLFDRDTIKNGAPDYPNITEEEFVPAVKEGIKRAKARIAEIKNNADEPDYENTILALETADQELSDTLSVFFNLKSAHATDGILALAKEISPLTAAYSNDISLDDDLFKRVDAVWQKKDKLSLNTEQKTVLENAWQGFVRNGAKLNAKDKEKLRAIDAKSATLSPQFAENVLKSTKAFELYIRDEARLDGVPEVIKAAAKEGAKNAGQDNAWRLTIDMDVYLPVMTYAKDRNLREQLWRASASRSYGAHDNQNILKDIVKLRHERANLLGYDTHADYVLERRMAGDPKTVMDFLKRIVDVAKPQAEKELQDLKDMAKADGIDEIKPWDLTYYSEKMKQKLYDFDSEEFRPYFQVENVMDGLFTHLNKLFGVEVKESSDYPVYHKDVKTYEVYDQDSGDFYGVLYVDLFPRDEKKSGAWMNPMRDRGFNMDGGIDCPLTSVVCNFTKPSEGQPSLLSLDEVETLFHEFGHAMHAMLTQVDHKSVSGASVLWDFVELPSQIMENWLTHKATFDLFAKHYQTGADLPEDLLNKMKKAENFMSGTFLLRQASLGLIDMAWHTADPSTIKDVVDFEDEAIKDTALMPRERPSCTSTAFSHIFAGGYSAGYYSYFWAEVLDADAFEEFLTNGLYDEATGRAFRDKILAKGGSDEPMNLFKDFKGREPDPDALLRKKGLLPKP